MNNPRWIGMDAASDAPAWVKRWAKEFNVISDARFKEYLATTPEHMRPRLHGVFPTTIISDDPFAPVTPANEHAQSTHDGRKPEAEKDPKE